MKRMISVIFAMTLALSLCLPCFAEDNDVEGSPVVENVIPDDDPAGGDMNAGNDVGGQSGGDQSGGDQSGGDQGGGDQGSGDQGSGDQGGGDQGGGDQGGSDQGGGDQGGGDQGGGDQGSGDQGGGEQGGGEQGGGEQGGEGAPTESTPTESTPTESAPTTQPTTEPPTTAPPTTAPTTQPPTYPGMPVVTKDPTSETVQVDGFAEFVARADYCVNIIWHLQSPGGGTDVLARNAPTRFPGLVVTGLESERLGLNHIPRELNEWRVRAEFVGYSGNVWSAAAVINVMNQELEPPSIQTQPQNASLKAGESVSLRVSAQPSQTGTTLTYQWYRNTVNSNVGGKAILGASADTYTPDYIQGTTYYYCAVRSTNGSEISAATKTDCAAVTYPAAVQTTGPAAQPTAQSASSATLVPWNQETEPAALPTVADPVPAPARSNTLLLVIVIVIIVIAILGTLAAVLILRSYSDRDDYREPVEIPKAVRRAPRQEPRREPRKEPEKEPWQEVAGEDEWDDLSDLGDLSIYLDDEEDDL